MEIVIWKCPSNCLWAAIYTKRECSEELWRTNYEFEGVAEYYFKMCYLCLCCGMFVQWCTDMFVSFMLRLFNFMACCVAGWLALDILFSFSPCSLFSIPWFLLLFSLSAWQPLLSFFLSRYWQFSSLLLFIYYYYCLLGI